MRFDAIFVRNSPPKDDPISVEDLKQYDGTDESKPVYVAVKGTVFDVSPKREMYAPGKGYHIFAGKDGSRGLGMSSLKPEDAVPDYSTLDDKQLKVLDDWVSFSHLSSILLSGRIKLISAALLFFEQHSYYTKRYNIVGKVAQS